MGRVAAIGEQVRIGGFALVGALAVPAETPAAARAAWRDLPPDVVLVLLSPAAAAALAAELGDASEERLTAVMPE